MTALATLSAPLTRIPASVAASPATLASLPGAATRYARNEEVFGEGDPAEFVYRLRSGTIRLYRILSDGRRMIGSFVFAGESFGLEAGDEHSFSAEAISDCEVVATPRASVLRRAESDPAFSHQLWRAVATELAGAREHLLLLGSQSAVERVGAFLRDMARRSTDRSVVTLPMSRQDIADYLGLTIETVSRTITQLTERGAIAVPTSRTIIIRNASLLRSDA